jgi:hypothetical protein
MESEAGAEFAQMGKQFFAGRWAGAGFDREQGVNRIEKQWDQNASILKWGGHKNGHNGQFCAFFAQS